jgi:hypothetical protein
MRAQDTGASEILTATIGTTEEVAAVILGRATTMTFVNAVYCKRPEAVGGSDE